jgi:hypothetical protein
VHQALVQRLNALSPEQAGAFHQWIAGHMVQGTAPVVGGQPQAHGVTGAVGSTLAPTGPTSGGLGLPGSAEAGFENQYNVANENANNQLATNEYQTALARNSYAPKLQALQHAQQNTRNALPDSYDGRGILGSGIYRQGVDEYNYDALQQANALQAGQSDTMNKLALQHQQIENQRGLALANLRAQHQAALAAFAAKSITG